MQTSEAVENFKVQGFLTLESLFSTALIAQWRQAVMDQLIYDARGEILKNGARIGLG